MKLKAALLLSVAAALSGCEASNDHIPKREQGQITSVVTGRIVSMRAVSIQSGDAGRYGPGIGSLLGKAIGTYTNSSRIIAPAAQLGGYAGVLGEQYLRKATGYEFVVQVDNGDPTPSARGIRQRNGGVISLIQTNSERLSVGDEVYLLIGTGQTRMARR